MDRESPKQFYLALEMTNVPTFNYLKQFLEKRCVVLEGVYHTSGPLPSKTQKV